MIRQPAHSPTAAGVGAIGIAALVALSACAVSPTATPVPSTPLPAATTTPPSLPEETPTPTAAPPTSTPAESATYLLAFEATWSEATHPLGFPPNPHFSGLIGASHASSVAVWRAGEEASPGIKNMAETGGKSPLDSEIDSLIGAGEACTVISGGGINPSPGVVTLTLTVSLDCPAVSVVSMIAPSPDWFVGVSGLDLLADGQWVRDAVVELFAYDAGTDSGDAYTAADDPTEEPEPIHLIDAEPLVIAGGSPPLGTFTFSLLGE